LRVLLSRYGKHQFDKFWVMHRIGAAFALRPRGPDATRLISVFTATPSAMASAVEAAPPPAG
jgi:hypothetical protein